MDILLLQKLLNKSRRELWFFVFFGETTLWRPLVPLTEISEIFLLGFLFFISNLKTLQYNTNIKTVYNRFYYLHYNYFLTTFYFYLSQFGLLLLIYKAIVIAWKYTNATCNFKRTELRAKASAS